MDTDLGRNPGGRQDVHHDAPSPARGADTFGNNSRDRRAGKIPSEVLAILSLSR